MVEGVEREIERERERERKRERELPTCVYLRVCLVKGVEK